MKLLWHGAYLYSLRYRVAKRLGEGYAGVPMRSVCMPDWWTQLCLQAQLRENNCVQVKMQIYTGYKRVCDIMGKHGSNAASNKYWPSYVYCCRLDGLITFAWEQVSMS